ncbi:MAG: MFS transporter [Gammaproteobacteria bacterium]|nr:MFS transporter [Gammaproteobacteria bacterium]
MQTRSAPEKLNALEKRAAVSLASIFSMRMLGLFMLMPIMAVYGQDLSGVSPFWIGLAIGAYGLTQAVFQIPMGWLSDRFGRRPIIVVGLIIFAIGSLIAGIANSIEMVTFGRAIQGMGAIASAVLALASDVTREEQRPKVMAVIGMSIGISFAVALVVGPMIANSFGLSGVFLATAVMAIIGVVIVYTIVPISYTQSNSGEVTASRSNISEMLTNGQLLRLDFGVLVLHWMMTSIFVALPILLTDSGMNINDHWQLYLPVLFLSFVFMVPMIIIAAKKSIEKQVFLIAIILIISASIVMAVSHSFWPLALTVFIFFIGFNFLEASLPAHVSRLAPAGQKGTAMGVYSSSQFLGAFLGGVSGGYIAGSFGFSYLFAANGIIALLWLVLALGMKLPPSSKRVSMHFEPADGCDYQKLIDALSGCEGVMEATLVEDESRIYLKVNKTGYDQTSVSELVSKINSSSGE